MKEKITKTGFAYIWQNQHENYTNKLGTVAKERRNDTETKCILDEGRENFASYLPVNEKHKG
jgi:hypothetical protein